ncbi:MAG: hypothetical protein HDR92_04645 [Bacteroides sp.]|nr:hypothetical protein [Bacteroides sp.]
MRFLSTLIISLAVSLSALASGSWNVHPVFSRPVTRAIETTTDVYYLAGGSLFGYDKKLDESRSYTVDNYLSSSADISNIFYDFASDRILIAYSDGNIDLMSGATEPESVINLPDIAAAVSIGSDRTINDAAFAGDTVYVATAFGLVVIDASKSETIASGIYPSPVTGVALTPSHIIIKCGSALYSIAKGNRISSLDHFTRLTSWNNVSEMTALSPSLLLLRRDSSSPEALYTLHFNGTSVSGAKVVDNSYRSASPFIFTPDGAVRYVASGNLYEINTEGNPVLLAPLHEDIVSDAIACAGTPSSIWAAGHDGITNYGYTAGAGWTMLSDRYKPEGLSVKQIAYVIPSSDGERAYFTNLGATVYRLGYPTGDEGLRTIQTTSRLEPDGSFTDVTAFPAPAANEVSASAQLTLGQYPISPEKLAEDPDDPSVYWLGTANDGLLRITDGELTGRYDETNSPFVPQWGCRVFDVTFDRGGNMWVASHTGKGTSGISVLPAEKRRMDPSDITPADWTVVDIPGYSSNKDVQTLHCRQSDMIFITDAGVGTLLVAIDTRGTFNDLTDDAVKVWDSFTDQDGKLFSPDRHTALAEDRTGRVWLGTNGGVAEIPYPSQATGPTLSVNRLKVPRNDGTNTADYLLESDMIYSIAVDHADRKWLATESSGVFLVSPRGDEIIATFNSSNSPLPSNRVNAVYCNPRSNAVYFGTDRGVVEYASTASPAADTYSDILIYPNPVGPDHGGPVTITGLLDSSLVKIADATGHLVWQGRSEGGMAQWPVSDMSGRRVRSGIYYLLVSQSGEGISTSGAVAKIAVVN